MAITSSPSMTSPLKPAVVARWTQSGVNTEYVLREHLTQLHVPYRNRFIICALLWITELLHATCLFYFTGALINTILICINDDFILSAALRSQSLGIQHLKYFSPPDMSERRRAACRGFHLSDGTEGFYPHFLALFSFQVVQRAAIPYKTMSANATSLIHKKKTSSAYSAEGQLS